MGIPHQFCVLNIESTMHKLYILLARAFAVTDRVAVRVAIECHHQKAIAKVSAEKQAHVSATKAITKAEDRLAALTVTLRSI